MMTTTMLLMLFAAAAMLPSVMASDAEYRRDLEITEGAPIGTRIGFIGDVFSGENGPPYLIIPVQDVAIDVDLRIDEKTGEIKTKLPLDRETRASYYFVAVPMNGQHIHVTIHVIDENDNAPTFPNPITNVEFPENTPRDVKRTLNPAKDADTGLYSTQKYNIISGNTNNSFRLSYHREKDGVLYLDMQINGVLDRETIPSYNLVIEALDGGNPPLRGVMAVNVTIQDVNDNQPVFNKTRYFGEIAENATIGTSILNVYATDADSGDNGLVEYSINHRQSDRECWFNMDAETGLISVNKPLDFERKDVHELVVVAKDRGGQPLETTAFVTIKVLDVNDNQPIINLIFLSDDATPKISESAQPGEFIARISVNDPDSKTEYSNLNVTLQGGDGHFGLTTQDSIRYLVILSSTIDRERKSKYTLSVEATDFGNPPLHASRTFDLLVTDVNDNAPKFHQNVFQANVLETAEPGTSVYQISAADEDEGSNGEVVYSILQQSPFLTQSDDTQPSSWFSIDTVTGLISTKSLVDCDTDPTPKLIIVAKDNGIPPLSSTVTVVVTIHDVNDNEPIFDSVLYNVTVSEDKPKGSCILKVTASDSDCGVNAKVNYTLVELGPHKSNAFYVKSVSGDVCVAADLDYEMKTVHEFLLVATDRGGLSATTTLKIYVTDVNDNFPIFHPKEYKISVSEDVSPQSPIAIVKATDNDSGKFGVITYRIVSGNNNNIFRIDRNTGQIFIMRTNILTKESHYTMNISATDGSGLKGSDEACIFIFVTASVRFELYLHEFSVAEDASIGSLLGNVVLSHGSYGSDESVKYFIESGNGDENFTIDSSSGSLKTNALLDHEKMEFAMVIVGAVIGTSTSVYTQVYITILDKNDNYPEFEGATIRLSVPENVAAGTPLLVAFADDKDSLDVGGRVKYALSSGVPTESKLFAVDSKAGFLTLTRSLDYESSRRHSLTITATDNGNPQLGSNMTVLLDVQDVNDNAPVFEQTEYTVMTSESLHSNSQIFQVVAVDLDTGNNAKITYKLAESEGNLFGIFPNSGWIYIKKALDREISDKHVLKIIATDNGSVRNTATAIVYVTVADQNDNDPVFENDRYEFWVEENKPRGTFIGSVKASDQDADNNAIVRYSLIPGNSSFQINQFSGEISCKEPLDREYKSFYEIVVEAKDQGSPSRSSRVSIRISVTDVNDNKPVLDDPQEDVVSIREEQPVGTTVVKVRATDLDDGYNATFSYSILKGRDTDGYDVFAIDPLSGVIKTRMVLDHEERSMYRIAVAATDHGVPSLQTVRILRVEVLDLNDNRPTFTSSSLIFRVREDVSIGHIVGNVLGGDTAVQVWQGHITYTLTFLSPANADKVFDIDRRSGTLIVTQKLDRESCGEYRLEVRALDTTTNPQSSAIVVKIEVMDVNDNPPKWHQDPISIYLPEDSIVGTTVWNFTAYDADVGPNGELRYGMENQWPETGYPMFSVDVLTGNLILESGLDFEQTKEYILTIFAMDQALNATERLTSMLTVKVFVTDINDNAPYIVSSSNIAVAAGYPRGSRLGRVIASDADSGDNGRVWYAIEGGNEDDFFKIDRETGLLTLAKTFDAKFTKEVKYYFALNISASDYGSPLTMKSFICINISTRVNAFDKGVKFTESVYNVNVSENVLVQTVIAAVSANVMSYTGYAGHRLVYKIPEIFQTSFKIGEKDGLVTLQSPLDRESTDNIIIPVLAIDTNSGQTDSAVLFIRILDSNDNAPSFEADTCGVVYVPENMGTELTFLHSIVAVDSDVENNAKISYSIIGGNAGNKFHVDARTGDLSAFPLDRETQSHYYLTISAEDHGLPSPMAAHCNLTIVVDDENDNEPIFEKTQYRVSVIENAPIGATILRVKATDADSDANGSIVYTLKDEDFSLFRVNNQTGDIIIVGFLDREARSSYAFYVIASDNGRYNVKWQSARVEITVEDANDNKPEFVSYPFTSDPVSPHIYAGSVVAKVMATDRDSDVNGEIMYKFLGEQSKFRINANTGFISPTASLASDAGRIFYLDVLATDKGSPPLSSQGLVEIKVGDGDASGNLRFQNSTYAVTIAENAPVGYNVIQVFAVKSDGRRQKIHYSMGSGNDNEVFEINTNTGVVRVKTSSLLDYEKKSVMRVTLTAHTENTTIGSPLLAFADLWIHLMDENDNSPDFTQDQYFASVLEGANKETFVTKILAVDPDTGANAKVSYHIVDGNHDNAFTIEPPASNFIKTNIVLDAEIRDNYKLTVIATDEGIPQLSSTATIIINVIDVNDNRPSFPPYGTLLVSESKPPGSVLITVSANDIDSYPPLMYSLDQEEPSDTFAIDRYSGRLILKKALDYEYEREYRLSIMASDGTYVTRTALIIAVTDANDHSPKFSKLFYHFDTNDFSDDPMGINATDADSEDNGMVSYSIVNFTPGFGIESSTGIFKINKTMLDKKFLHGGYFDLLIKATDHGDVKKSTVVGVRFKSHLNSQSAFTSVFSQLEYRVSICENTPKGKVILKLGAFNMVHDQSQYSIIDGNEDNKFDILSPNGDLVLVNSVDRELCDVYSLRVALGSENSPSSSAYIHVVVEDSNDNSPQFTNIEPSYSVSESLPPNSIIARLVATDADLPPNSDIRFSITSGNDAHAFILDDYGTLKVGRALDYDAGESEYNLVVMAMDGGKKEVALATAVSVKIIVKDENDNNPKFPVAEYLEFVGENEAVGSTVFVAKAVDLDRGPYGKVNYSIVSSAASGFADVDDSWKLFKVDAETGLVTTNAAFDYEVRSRYAFTLLSCDYGGKCVDVKVRVEVESKDEFHPQFTERTYRFSLSGVVGAGFVVGYVVATDRDKGVDGRVLYQLTTQNPYFKVNRTTGAVMVKKKLDDSLQLGQDVSLVVTASSGRQGSLTNVSVVEITLDATSPPGLNMASSKVSSGVSHWILTALVLIVLAAMCSGLLVVILHVKNRRQKKANKSGMGSGSGPVTRGDNGYLDTGAFDTMPVGRGTQQSQFPPPKYDEIPTYRAANNGSSSNSGAATTSELSASEQSGSSGRGSAEDAEDVDEEIRMINEVSLKNRQRRSGGGGDDDNLSDVSVHNTQEYLARLGIMNSQAASNSVSQMEINSDVGNRRRMVGRAADLFDESGGETDIANIIYAKLNDVVGGGGSSSECGGNNTITDLERNNNAARAMSVDRGVVLEAYQGVNANHPAMSGSLSSIVHSEEELTGSYNWDYLLDWGPQYQPLAHVFSEIARLKDDAASVKSGVSGTSSSKGKSQHSIKVLPPPLLTNVAPRSVAAPTISSSSSTTSVKPHHSTPLHSNHMSLLPRSPIGHDAVGEFSTSAAMSPSFSPSLSPLATRSPSSSPLQLHSVGHNSRHISRRHRPNDTDVRI